MSILLTVQEAHYCIFGEYKNGGKSDFSVFYGKFAADQPPVKADVLPYPSRRYLVFLYVQNQRNWIFFLN
jgi:hypothetical protein